MSSHSVRSMGCALGMGFLLATLPGVSAQPHEQKFRGLGFPDFGFMVSPTEYSQKYSNEPVFRLKTDFPKGTPPKTLPEFMTKIDFREHPMEYLTAAQRYAFEGNLPAFGGGKIEWDPFENDVREWYHIPWLHPNSPTGYPPNGGTEGFRGLIKEAEVTPYQLAGTQMGSYQVYAVTLVNEYAGYTMSRMWKDPNNPDLGATDKRYGGGFPPGTVFAKFLFTDAPGKPEKDSAQPWDTVPYLENNVEWQVYITESWDAPNRVVKTVRLLQMDMMMRDPRAEEFTGWVFGTFAYNGAVDNKKSKFLNLVPLGLMWGNDPDNTDNRVNPYPPKPVSQIINPDLKQQKIFDLKECPPQHLGWNSRLNGPADLNTSSCMSCHITAEFPSFTSLVAPSMTPAGGPVKPPLGGTKGWMKWFQNIQCATPIDEQAYSTDMSWQIAIAFQNFFGLKGQQQQGEWTKDYQQKPNVIGRGGSE